MNRFKYFFLITMAILPIVLLLWAIGFWNSQSPRYWRRPAQSVAFFSARHTPSRWTGSLTRWALRMHIIGTTYDELEEAANNFARVKENDTAARLLLTLAREDILSGRETSALNNIKLAYTIYPSEEALADIVIMTAKSKESNESWVSELRARYPLHHLNSAFECAETIKSFAVRPTASCLSLSWISEKTSSKVMEYNQLTRQIADLPDVSRRKVKALELSVSLGESKNSYYYSQLADLDQEKTNLVLRKVGNVIWKLLPLPEPGDTFETWLAREAIVCKIPYIRFFCKAEAFTPLLDISKEQERIESDKSDIRYQISLNNNVLSRYRNDLSYWKSNKPFQELVTQRENLVHQFQDEIRQTVYTMKDQIGNSISEAIFYVTE